MLTSIIVLAQHLDSLIACLNRIRLYTDNEHEVIVVNEGGRDAISYWLQQEDGLISIFEKDCKSVSEAYNAGAKRASGERLVFMRDHIAVSEGWLDRLHACMDRHADSAMVGPMMDGVSGAQGLPYAFRTMEQLDTTSRALAIGKNERSRKSARLLSLALMVKSSLFDRLGGFDERFLEESYEDDDLSLRMLQAGYKLYIAEDSLVRCMPRNDLRPDHDEWYAHRIAANREIARSKWGFDLTEKLFAWSGKVTVTLCMIVKNEEETLGRCLSSVRRLVDEIVIVDTGSVDRTKEIAAGFGAKLFDFQWIDDFAAARNFAFDQATQEYILWLDADDRLEAEDAAVLEKLTNDLPWNVDAVSMPYHLGEDNNGNVVSSLRRNRLVKRENRFRWIGIVHEYLEVGGHTIASEAAVTHDRRHKQSDRNLNMYKKREQAGEAFTPRDMYYYANELRDHGAWEEAADRYSEFLKRRDVWSEDRIAACAKMGEALWQLGRKEEARIAVLQGFAFDLPRAEHCCLLGRFYMEENSYAEAIFWYKTAAASERPRDSLALLQHACWTWLPHLQLCVCYDKIGEYALAAFHNEEAAKYMPDDARVIGNRNYFMQRLQPKIVDNLLGNGAY